MRNPAINTNTSTPDKSTADVTPEKATNSTVAPPAGSSHHASTQPAASANPGSGDDISPQDLLEVISQEWKKEMERIV